MMILNRANPDRKQRRGVLDIIVSIRSHNTYGGNTTFSLVGDYLQDGLKDYGSAIRNIEITACFRGGPPGHSSLQANNIAYHDQFLPSLPIVKFFRKKSRVTICYETKVADGFFLEKYGYLNASVFKHALAEVASQIRLIDARLKKSDSFDAALMHADIQCLIESCPATDDELRDLEARLKSEAQIRRAAMDPWDLLDIDWDDYHPSARQLLDDPFLWSCIDDFSPHGNDTGADLLADFRRWNRRHPARPAHEMARAELKQWGFREIDFTVTDEAAVRELEQSSKIDFDVANEAFIAAAFASMKLRGACDDESKNLALKAVERSILSFSRAPLDEKELAEGIEKLNRLKAILEK